MKFRTKLIIFLVAVLLTLIGFNSMVSTAALEIITVGNEAGYEIIANVLAKSEVTTHKTATIL